MVRKIGAVLLGVLTLGAVVMTLQQVSVALWPLPEGLDPFDPAQADAWSAYLESMPSAAWLLAIRYSSASMPSSPAKIHATLPVRQAISGTTISPSIRASRPMPAERLLC